MVKAEDSGNGNDDDEGGHILTKMSVQRQHVHVGGGNY